MKKVQLDRYDMVLSVESYLKEHAELFASNAPMVATVGALSTKISELKTQVAFQLVNNKGIAIQKKDIRKELQRQAFVLASACCSYASAVGDAEFFRRCHYTKSVFIHFRDMELVGICGEILREVSSHASALLAYNVTPIMISDFQSARTDFMEVMGKPREALSKKADTTAKIELLLTEILEIIRIRLDMDMVSMQGSEAQFVAVYKNQRRIRKTAVHKRSLTVIVRDADTKKPIADAVLETGKNIRRKSGEKGMSYIDKLPEGRHQLRILHPDYEPQTMKFSILSYNATKLEMSMRRFRQAQPPSASSIGDTAMVPELVEGAS